VALEGYCCRLQAVYRIRSPSVQLIGIRGTGIHPQPTFFVARGMLRIPALADMLSQIVVQAKARPRKINEVIVRWLLIPLNLNLA
jgi:hypothetical protein